MKCYSLRGVAFSLLAALTAVLYHSVVEAGEPIDNPAVVSDVRVVQDASGTYIVTWRDNSDDETRFEVGIWATNALGDTVLSVGLGRSSENATSFHILSPWNNLEEGCHTAHVLVFAVRGDQANGMPGNATLPLCRSGGMTRFPSAGSGVPVVSPIDARIPVLLAALGLLGLAMGLRSCVREASRGGAAAQYPNLTMHAINRRTVPFRAAERSTDRGAFAP